MYHTSVGTFILKMHKPILSLCRAYPSALMWAVDVRLALSHYSLVLIRSVRAFRTHGQLPSGGYASCRAHYPIPPVMFVELRTFSCVVLVVSVKHYHRIANGPCSVSRKLSYRQHTLESGTTACPSVHEIASAVVIPQRCGVNHTLTWNNKHRIVPSSGWILCLDHIHAIVRISPIYIILAVVISYAWSPYTHTVSRFVKHLLWSEFTQSMPNNLPVHKVFGM